jgi:hypothetical protein
MELGLDILLELHAGIPNGERFAGAGIGSGSLSTIDTMVGILVLLVAGNAQARIAGASSSNAARDRHGVHVWGVSHR